MRNIETKARIDDLTQVRRVALDTGARDLGIQRDTDIYFQASHGRLKLRVSDGVPGGTLIAYQRPDRTESRVSDYQLVPVSNPDVLRDALAETLGVLATVRKSRQVLIYGKTRIHLDDVDGLGTFVELETVLEGQSIEEAESEHQFLRSKLGLNDAELVPVSYSDLLMERTG